MEKFKTTHFSFFFWKPFYYYSIISDIRGKFFGLESHLIIWVIGSVPI